MQNIAVIGFGFMGITHTINILKNPQLNLVAIVARNPDGIYKKLAEQVGNFSTGAITHGQLNKVKLYASLDECISNEKIDACIIAVHTHLHFEFTVKALQAGIHVFLEKPASLNIDECTQMIALAKQKKLVLMVGHVVRFMPPYQKLKQWIENETYGELKFLSLTRVSGLPLWGNWVEMQKDFGSSGGALFDLVIHDIDYAAWVLGQPETIIATCLPGKLSNQDYVKAVWKYKSGVQVSIDGGNTFHSSFPFHAAFTARFKNATVSYSSKSPDNIIVSTDAETTLVAAGDANEGFNNELVYFISCIIHQKKPELCTPQSALTTIQICYQHIND